MVLAVLRDVIGRFEITRKEDLKVPPVGDFFLSFFFFSSFFSGLCGGLQSCLAHVEGCGILQSERM